MSEDTAPGTDDVAGSEFEWVWKDPSHLEAHRHEFYVSPDEILELLKPLVAPPAESGASLHKHYVLDRIVGESGLRKAAPTRAARCRMRCRSTSCAWWSLDAATMDELGPELLDCPDQVLGRHGAVEVAVDDDSVDAGSKDQYQEADEHPALHRSCE